jgi:hypothetical protein
MKFCDKEPHIEPLEDEAKYREILKLSNKETYHVTEFCRIEDNNYIFLYLIHCQMF